MSESQLATPPSVPVEEWGRRLTDAVRAALDEGDLDGALRLVREGDGQARNLATEYFLMFKGLLGTARAIVDVLLEGPTDGLPVLFHDFRTRFADAVNGAFGDITGVLPPMSDDPAAEVDGTWALLTLGLSRFEDGQRALAATVERAIEAGDVAEARRALDEKVSRQYLPMHDSLIRFFADAMAWVHRRGGADELLRFQLAVAQGQRVGIDRWEALPVADFARTFAFLLKQHMGQLEVREEDDRFVFDQALCGSGGRLIAAGAYEGPGALPMVEDAPALNAGRPSFPVYCTHCPGWNAVAPEQWYGHAHVEYPDPARPTGGCTLHILKNR
ncbi:MAG: hypothetical protein ABWY29_10015 [Blastococcus sp.]